MLWSYKKYLSHMFGCSRNDDTIYSQINYEKADRKYMEQQLEVHTCYLYQRGITNYQNFQQTLYLSGFKADEERDLILSFENKFYKKPLLKKREFKKSNSRERNLLLNRIALEYPSQFLTHLFEYIKSKKFKKNNDHMNEKDQNILIAEYSKKIDQLLKPTCQNEIIANRNTVEKTNEIYDILLIDSNLMDSEIETDDSFINIEKEVFDESKCQLDCNLEYFSY